MQLRGPAPTHAIRKRHGIIRFQIYQASYESALADLRNTLGNNDFETTWVAGAELSTDGMGVADPHRRRCRPAGL